MSSTSVASQWKGMSLDDLNTAHCQMVTLLNDRFGLAAAIQATASAYQSISSHNSTDSTPESQNELNTPSATVASHEPSSNQDLKRVITSLAELVASFQDKADEAQDVAYPDTETSTSGDLGLQDGFMRRLSDQQAVAGFSDLWKRGLQLAKHQIDHTHDPWTGRKLHKLPVEHCARERYDPHTKAWTTDDVLVKMEDTPFANGAMRACFAMKKQSTLVGFKSWKAADNFVAKLYLKDGVPDEDYYSDCILQMDAKVLGEAYNLTSPPKQVDIMQSVIIRFVDRPNKPVYSVENTIMGDYVKYNSNSGFVRAENDAARLTPQAFSHFTFDHTCGQQLCVDIQGVGDLYTDPQIHTFDREGYGDGNLGLRGMAYFFRSHECNAICKKMGLKPFERCHEDKANQGYTSKSPSATLTTITQPRASIPSVASKKQGTPARHKFQRRSTTFHLLGHTSKQITNSIAEGKELEGDKREQIIKQLANVKAAEPLAHVHFAVSRLYAEVVLLPDLQPDEDPDDALEAAIFHLQIAGVGGVQHALLILSKIFCGMEPLLAPFAAIATHSDTAEDIVIATELLASAARLGVRNAAKVMALSLHRDTNILGVPLSESDLDSQAAKKAADWYKLALSMDPCNEVDEDELEMLVELVKDRHQVLAEYGKLLMAGGRGLEANPGLAWEQLNEAAEEAMTQMKGKLSQQYYELAAEAEGLMPDDGAA